MSRIARVLGTAALVAVVVWQPSAGAEPPLVEKRPTKLTLTANKVVAYGDTLHAQAKLESMGKPVPNVLLYFWPGSTFVYGATGSNGIATVDLKPDHAGTMTLYASFGSPNYPGYLASKSETVSINVLKGPTEFIDVQCSAASCTAKLRIKLGQVQGWPVKKKHQSSPVPSMWCTVNGTDQEHVFVRRDHLTELHCNYDLTGKTSATVGMRFEGNGNLLPSVFTRNVSK